MHSRAILPLLALLALQPACDNSPLGQEDTEPPKPEKIVFSARGAGSDYQQIFTINADGTGLTQITPLWEHDSMFPSWSPNGDSIVFVSDSLNDGSLGAGVFIASADGSTLRPFMVDMTSILLGEFSIWSPAGDRLATFHCGSCGPRKSSGSISILPMDQAALQGAQSALRGYRRGGYPAFSSDGAILAYIDYDLASGYDQIFTDQPDFLGSTSAYRRITETSTKKRTPVWSPDDTYIAFLAGDQIFIHNLESGTEKLLVAVNAASGQVPISLHGWAVDEEAILLATFQQNGQDSTSRNYLYTVGVESGALTLVLPDSTVTGADWHLSR